MPPPSGAGCWAAPSAHHRPARAPSEPTAGSEEPLTAALSLAPAPLGPQGRRWRHLEDFSCQPPPTFQAVPEGARGAPGAAESLPRDPAPDRAGAGARGAAEPAGQLRKLRSGVYKRGGQAWSLRGIEESRRQQLRGKSRRSPFSFSAGLS